jgi:YggT family protein
MSTAITVISFLFQIYSFLILIRVVLTWINTNPYRQTTDHPAVRILNQITDPVLEPLRRIIPPIGGTLDISPVVALIILEILRFVVIRVLSSL